jgi:gluconate 5-dehydrogenase
MHLNELFDLSGMSALVTGGSRGLGLEIAMGLGAAGASVTVTARRESWLSNAEQELRSANIDCLALACNVSKPDQVAATVTAAVARFGRIDILVNNAGTSWAAPAETMPLEQWRDVFETNATGSFLMSQAAGREMMAAQRGGSIINIASIMGLIGMPADVLHAIGYSASKGAVISMTRDLAVKWARHGIRVNAVAPGFFETRLTAGMLERSRAPIERFTPMGRIGHPGELKDVIVFLASRASAYITGQVLSVDGGATAW